MTTQNKNELSGNTRELENSEEKWREEFEQLEVLYVPHPMEAKRDYLEKNPEGDYRWHHIREDWQVYLAACKKRQEEIDRLNVFLQCKPEGQINAEIVRLEAEIQKLKKENERFKNAVFLMSIKIVNFKALLVQAKPWVIYVNLMAERFKENDTQAQEDYKISQQWLKKYEEVVSGK